MKARILPVSQQQNDCLVMLHQPDTTEESRRSWIGQRAVRVRPGLDLDRMRRAVAEVVSRHDALRVRFVEKKRGWSAVVEPEGRGFFETRDLGVVSPGELAAHIKAGSAPPENLSKDPLFRVTVFRCGKSGGDVIHIYLHHLLVDGWSYMLVLGEVFQAYVGAPLTPLSGATLEDYLLRFGGAATPEATAAGTDLAKAILFPALPAPRIGRAAKGVPSNLSSGDVHASAGFSTLLASSAVEKVRAGARFAGVSETVMMAAAFARAISLASDRPDLYMLLAISGRSDAHERLVGWLACAGLIRCENARGEMPDLARRISSQLRQIQETAPLENVLFHSDMARDVADQGGFTRQFFCGMYLPEGVAKATPLSGLMMGPPDGKISFGGIEVAMMPNPNADAETKFELSLQSVIRGDSYAYRTSYDITAFERDEAAAITLQTLKGMGCNESEVRIE